MPPMAVSESGTGVGISLESRNQRETFSAEWVDGLPDGEECCSFVGESGRASSTVEADLAKVRGGRLARVGEEGEGARRWPSRSMDSGCLSSGKVGEFGAVWKSSVPSKGLATRAPAPNSAALGDNGGASMATNVARTGDLSPIIPSLLARSAASLFRGGRGSISGAVTALTLSSYSSSSLSTSLKLEEDASACFESQAFLILFASLAAPSSSVLESPGTTTVNLRSISASCSLSGIMNPSPPRNWRGTAAGRRPRARSAAWRCSREVKSLGGAAGTGALGIGGMRMIVLLRWGASRAAVLSRVGRGAGG